MFLTMLSSGHSPKSEKDVSKFGKDVDEAPSEKGITFENLCKEEAGVLSACASSVNWTKTEMPETLSKRQLKKLRKKEKWLAYKPIKRAKEKLKLRQKKLDARQNNVKLGPSRKELKHSKMSQSNCKVRVAIDLSFDDLMNDKEISKCVKQLLRCYSLNRRAKDPVQFYITSFDGRCKAEMQKHTGYQNWDVYFHNESYADVFESKDLVYLTSESHSVISSLEADKVYVIGGLVDHNSYKGLCHQIAEEKGIRHGQLPIGEFLEMKTRKVLTIDHVFEIILEVTRGKSWKEALLNVLPPRKGAVEKVEEFETFSTSQCIEKKPISTVPETDTE
ncbi:tRNA methyltransferase 10 homolog A isoform X1 [Zootermopsis nevadensis]|uniref:tRNA (guanine(9)-N(1))-methyltransferase n=1 Tax=Zootermopsis nevadensis TaxID=136037 RepID=A0A067QXJ0_ZOONE|nr:tRNA methyltransferase 10 homolog A isoform X1 [Zootermopsis nevadensis]KDR15159.1 RNA (guanine-9-)-methyltransferase domain-containing protein 2 [Zootermopsis nevadensis]